MRTKHYILPILIIGFVFMGANAFGQKKSKKQKTERIDTMNYIITKGDLQFEIIFLKGEAFNHPTFAIWLEDENGQYLESLFVTEYFATGIFGHADAGDGSWKAGKGESIRPASLPYWSHKRNVISRDSLFVPTPENPVTDAVTGATPAGSFVMKTSAKQELPQKFTVLFEINQTWDWNDYWTNNKYSDNNDYKASAQPSVVYKAEISKSITDEIITLEAIGHGHYSGSDGSLADDLSTLTTALQIANRIEVKIIED